MTRTIIHNRWARAALALFVLLGVMLCTFPVLHTKAAEVKYQNVPEPTENSIIFSLKTEPNKYITIKKGGAAQYQEGGKGDGGWQYDGDPGEKITLTVKVLNPHGDYFGRIVYYSKEGTLRNSFLQPVVEEQMDGSKAGDNTEFKESYYDAFYKEILEADQNAQVIVYCQDEAEVLSGSFAELYKNKYLNLDTKNLKKITFQSPKQTPTKMALVVGSNSKETMFLKNGFAYFTPGTYELGLNIRSEFPDSGSTWDQDNEYWYFDEPITIKNATTLTLDFKDETQKYTLNFDKAYDSASQFGVDIYIDHNNMRVDEQVIADEDYPSGSYVTAYKNGYPYYSVYLKQDDITFYFSHNYYEEKKSVNSINIGRIISGALDYEPTDKFTNEFKPGTDFRFTDYSTDEYGNYCGGGSTEEDKSWESKVEGYIVFTEKDTGEVIYQTLDHKDYGYLVTKLPSKEGNYSIEATYFTKAKMPKNPVTPENPGIIAGSPKTLNGLVKGPDGKWAMYKNGKVDTTATGIFQNENGWWRVEKGYVNFKANGIYQNENGWWKTTNGKVTFKETGVFQNENGWWRVEDSKVNFKANGIYQNENGWWKTTNGKVTFKETGVFQNSNGWWRVENSKVNFKANGIYQNEYGWWKTTNGKVTFKENGIFQNENGKWVVKDSKVDFSANGFVSTEQGTYWVENGKVDTNKNGKFESEGTTFTLKNGEVIDF